jgi:NADPH2:quinone reductase
MRAALYRETGPARDVLRIEDVDPPEPGPGEVLVRIRVSAVNPTDVKARSGAVPRPIDGFQVPHQDGAGVIESVGDGVDSARIGQRVWLMLAAAGRYGTAGELCVVPQEQALPLPEDVSFELGASLGVPAVTASACLLADGPIEGQTVLVAGGAGAVGHFAIELARLAGARVVTTVSSPEKAELATAAGADLVVNYREPGALDRIRTFSPPVDRVIEVNLGANLDLDLELARPGTRVVCYAATGDDPVLPVRACMTANVVLRFMLLYRIPRPALLEAARGVNDAVAAKALTELPLHTFGLDDVVAAHKAQEAGVTGKVLVTLP